MRMRCTCNLTQEQERIGYDRTLASIHSSFVQRVVELEWKIVGHTLAWHDMDDGTQYLIETIEVDDDAENILDESFINV